MAYKFSEIRESVKEKIYDKEKERVLESDEEYYFAVGQLVGTFISLSKAKNVMQSLINPFINAKANETILEKLKQYYKKYNYMIGDGKMSFNHIYSMIIGYKPDGTVNQDMIIYGYLSNRLVYFKEDR